MAYNSLPSQAYLTQCLRYHEADGSLAWVLRPLEHFPSPAAWRRWNAQRAGQSAGFVDRSGYIRIGLDGNKYAAHRVIWVLCKGNDPSDTLDHINGVKHDNRLSNLRVATSSQQRRNQLFRATQGFTRVGALFQAQIYIDGARILLGTYATEAEARAAYRGAVSLHVKLSNGSVS